MPTSAAIMHGMEIAGGPSGGQPPSVFLGSALIVAPLSDRERRGLVRILGLTSDDRYPLGHQRKYALENYLRVVTSPPLDPNHVVRAARSLIETWADSPSPPRSVNSTRPKISEINAVIVGPASPSAIGVAEIRKRRAQPIIQALPQRRAQPILAELLELENTNAATQPMTPTAIADVIRTYYEH